MTATIEPVELPPDDAIPFPSPADPERFNYGSVRARREQRPIMVYEDMASELSISALGAYVRIAARWQNGRAVDRDLLAELENVDDVLDELFGVELLCTPEQWAVLRAVRVAEADARRAEARAARKAPRFRPVAPDPWPAPGAGRWTGTRTDYYGTTRYTVPRVVGVYLLYDEADRLLYVGQSREVGDRIGGHFDKPWTRYVARECSDVETSLWLEAGEIRWGDPLLNRDRDCHGRCAVLPRRRPKGVAAL